MSRNDKPKNDESVTFTAGTVKQGEPAETTVPRWGVIVNDENGVTLERPDGSTLIQRADGSAVFRDMDISRIAVADLRAISGYKLAEVFGTISHSIEFASGGTFAFLADKCGKILEVHFHGEVDCVVDKRNVLTLHEAPNFAEVSLAANAMEAKCKVPQVTERAVELRKLLDRAQAYFKDRGHHPDGDKRVRVGVVDCRTLKRPIPGEDPLHSALLDLTPSGITLSGSESTTAYYHTGTASVHHRDGTVEWIKPLCTQVGVMDLRTIADYTVNHTFDMHSHSIEFVGGARFSCLVNRNGTIAEFLTDGVDIGDGKSEGSLVLEGTSPHFAQFLKELNV